MTRFIRNLLLRPVRPAAPRTVRRPRFAVEALEGRDVPAVISLSGGILTVTGDAANNAAVVSQVGNQIVATIDAVKATYAAASVQQINFFGGDGNDSFTNNTGLTSVAYGQNGTDALVGGSGADLLYGGAGGDTLDGRGGNDYLVGEAGNDTYVFAGVNLGSDTVVEAPGGGTDALDFSKFGPAIFAVNSPPPGVMLNLALTTKQVVGGADLSLTLSDAAGIENVNGSAFDDLIYGNAQANTVHGNAGIDRLYGQAGDDVLYGDAGNDVVHGGDGNDIVCGGAGNDMVSGDAGNDFVYGGAGNDTLFGGVGTNWLYGEDGNDTLVTINGAGGDHLTGGNGTDTFWIDPADQMADAAPGEKVHAVNSFMSYSIPNGQGGHVNVPVNAIPNGANLADPSTDQANVDLWNYSDTPLFSANGPAPTDIRQGVGNDCYFLSKLAAVAKTRPDAVRQLVTEMGDGTYAVNFKDVNGQNVFVRVDGDLWSTGAPFNPTPVEAGVGNGSIWVAIVEKAWAFYRNHDGSYASIAGGNNPGIDPTVALGFVPENHSWQDYTKATDYANGVDFLNAIKADLAAGKAITIGGPSGWSSASDVTDPNNLHRGQHIFMVDSVLTDANGNPTGLKVYDLFGNYRTIMGPALVFHCSGGFQSFKC